MFDYEWDERGEAEQYGNGKQLVRCEPPMRTGRKRAAQDLVLNGLRCSIPEEWRPALEFALGGDVGAAGQVCSRLSGYNQAYFAQIMYEYRVAPDALRIVLHHALTLDHAYRAVMEVAKTRQQLSRWCRYAAFELPPTLPEEVTIYRGVHGISKATAAKGLSWSLSFACAAWFALRRGSDTYDPMVLQAHVPAAELIFYSDERCEEEVIPAHEPKLATVCRDLHRLRAGMAAHDEKLRKRREPSANDVVSHAYAGDQDPAAYLA